MECGALVMLDALGFKGIWKKHDAQDVVAKLEHLKSVVEQSADFIGTALRGNAPGTVKVRFLSDTIIIGVSGYGSAERDLERAVIVAAKAMRDACEREPVLAYRGAIAYGEYMISEQHFIVGPAVDDAAKHMDMAEGAFVWFVPAALRMLPGAFEKARTWPPLQRFSVPLKGGSTYDTVAVTPFVATTTQQERGTVVDAIVATFASDDIQIAVKQQRTMAFLDAVTTRLDELG